MQWIKRNLLFVIGCAAAILLMAGAGWFAYTNWSSEAGVKDELSQLVSEWQRLNGAPQYPSDENIAVVKADQKNIKEIRNETVRLFPKSGGHKPMTDQEFAAFLGATIADLRSGAAKSGVFLPDNYEFTFAAQRKSLKFASGSIDQWMNQIEDIRAICDALYHARVNAFDGIQRVPVSPQDGGSQDFLGAGIVSNQFGVFTPYQITFRSFSSEIAGVLEQMLASTNCMIVKSISIGPATVALPTPVGAAATAGRSLQVQQYQAPQPYVGKGGPAEDLLGGRRSRVAQPVNAPTVAGRAPAAPAPVTLVSEQPLQTTILLDCVKLNTTP